MSTKDQAGEPKTVHHAHGHHHTRQYSSASSTLGSEGAFSVEAPSARVHGLSPVAQAANEQESARRRSIAAHPPHSMEELAQIDPTPEDANWHWVETGRDVGQLAWATSEQLPQLPACDVTPHEPPAKLQAAGTGNYRDQPDGSAVLE